MRHLLLLITAAASLSAQRPEDLISSGPMIGHVTETTANLWIRTTTPARVAFKYWPKGKPEAALWSKTITTKAEDALCAEVTLTDLPFGVEYGFGVAINGDLAPLGRKLAFTTQPHWRWRTDPPDATIAIGSCAYHNDPPFDRPGKPYGDSDASIYQSIVKQKPDLMLWLGDNVYFREPDWSSGSAMLERYAKARTTPELQPLLSACPNYAIWDDHDFGGDNSDWTNPLKREALRAFDLFWANPRAGLDDTPGTFTRFTWSDVEFFLLDDRYYRTVNEWVLREGYSWKARDAEDKTMWGKRQLRWLCEGLVSSDHRFKVIVNGNQILNPAKDKETAQRYQSDLRALYHTIAAHRVTGVVILSGDRHYAEILKDEKALELFQKPYPLYEFTTSPLLSGLHELTEDERKNPLRIPGKVLDSIHNFGLLKLSGKGDDRTLTMECLDKHGQVRFSHAIKASELTFGR